MRLRRERRNDIAWRFVVQLAKEHGKSLKDYDDPDTRQAIRMTAEALGISFEECMRFAWEVISEVSMPLKQ